MKFHSCFENGCLTIRIVFDCVLKFAIRTFLLSCVRQIWQIFNVTVYFSRSICFHTTAAFLAHFQADIQLSLIIPKCNVVYMTGCNSDHILCTKLESPYSLQGELVMNLTGRVICSRWLVKYF